MKWGGRGDLTSLLLKHSWKGTVYDLSSETCAGLSKRFSSEIAANRLVVRNDDFLNYPILEKENDKNNVDLIISSMMLEHLNSDEEKKFMNYSRLLLRKTGRMVTLIPSSPNHWGIEDDIAGHYRRYTRNAIFCLFEETGWDNLHMAGLTYPVSNLLLPLSNFLVMRSEKHKVNLSMQERTKLSGCRKVQFKTQFPNILAALLNRWTLLPLYWVQKLFSSSPNALVLYFEATPTIETVRNEA